MPQLDFITYWIFSPIYYILVEWHVFLFIFVSLASFFFFSYKFYSKEINLMGLDLIHICIFIYKKFLSIWFSIEFFFFTNTLSLRINSLILAPASKESNEFLRLISRLFDYWIVAIQGGFGYIIKWISILFPGSLITWGLACVMSYIFGMTFELQVMYCFFAFVAGIFCFRFGLWEPGFIWNLYDPFNQKPWINDWEDIDIIELKPWHLNTFHGCYMILFTWLALKVWGFWYLPYFSCKKPDLLMNQDLVEFGFDVKISVFSRSYIRQPIRIPIPRKWEVITPYIYDIEKDLAWKQFQQSSWKKVNQELKKPKNAHEIMRVRIIRKYGPTQHSFARWWNHTFRVWKQTVISQFKANERSSGLAYAIVPVTKSRIKTFKLRDRLSMQQAFKHDPMFQETRKRHKFFKIKFSDMWLSSKILRAHQDSESIFMEYLSYPHLWSNRLVNFSFYFSNLYDLRKRSEGKPIRVSGNKWYLSGYLVDVYQKQLIDLKKLYRLYLTYAEIIYKLEKRVITVPEFRVLVEFSIKPLFSAGAYPFWSDTFVSHNLVKSRSIEWELAIKNEIRCSSPEYHKKWHYLYPKLSKKVNYLTDKLKKAEDLFYDQRLASFKIFVEEVNDYFKQHPGMTKKQKKKFKKAQLREFAQFWLDNYRQVKLETHNDLINLVKLKDKIAYLEHYHPIIKPNLTHVYLSSLHSKLNKNYMFHDPLGLDLDLRFVEWHPIIGPLNKEDFLQQSAPIERNLRPGWSIRWGPSVYGSPAFFAKPFYIWTLTKPTSIYNNNISFAAQKTYDYWFSLYQHLVTQNPEYKKYPKKLNNEIFTLTFRKSLIRQDLSTKQLLQSLVSSGVLKDFLVETKLLDKSIDRYKINLPEKDWFFNLNPRMKIEYPWMGQGTKIKFTNKKNILWIQPRKQGLMGAKVIRPLPETIIQSYGGIPKKVLVERMRRRLRMHEDIHYFDIAFDWLFGDYVRKFWKTFSPGWFGRFIQFTKHSIWGPAPVYNYTFLTKNEKGSLIHLLKKLNNTTGLSDQQLFLVFVDQVVRQKKPRQGLFWQHVKQKYSLKFQTFIMNICVDLQYIRYIYRSFFITLNVQTEILNFKKTQFSHPFYFLSNRDRKLINNYIIKTGAWDILDVEKRDILIKQLYSQKRNDGSKK